MAQRRTPLSVGTGKDARSFTLTWRRASLTMVVREDLRSSSTSSVAARQDKVERVREEAVTKGDEDIYALLVAAEERSRQPILTNLVARNETNLGEIRLRNGRLNN